MEKYDPRLKERARRLRNEMTEHEKLLWEKIRRKQLEGVQFYRQKVVGHFIVDFYAPAAKLVVEIDGSQHDQEVNAESDYVRDMSLKERNLTVMRFKNEEVVKYLDQVVQQIRDFCARRSKE